MPSVQETLQEVFSLSQGPTLPKEATAFLNSLIGKSPNTKRLYLCILSSFFSFYQKNLKELTTNDVVAFLSYLEKKEVARNTLRVNIIVLKSFLKSIGLNHIADRIKNIKETRTPPVTLSKADI